MIRHPILRYTDDYQPPPGTWSPLNHKSIYSLMPESLTGAQEFYTELCVTNLDSSMSPTEIQGALFSMFRDVVDVSQVEVYETIGGSFEAIAKVPHEKDALPLIHSLQRRKLGANRIFIALCKDEIYESNIRSCIPYNPHGPFMEPMSDAPMINFSPNFCPLHCTRDIARDWIAKEVDSPLPYVLIGLPELDRNMRILLKSHGGSIPLGTLVQCYNTEIAPGFVHEKDWGVPLEHLLTCLPGMHRSPGPHFRLSYCPTGGPLRLDRPILANLSRELVRLISEFPAAVIPLSSLPNSFISRFGKSLQPQDYGYMRLIDIVEDLPGSLQVIGRGSQAFLTLSHREQIGRFTRDLRRVLLSQSKRCIRLREFPGLYEKEFGKTLCIRNYGVCSLEDILPFVSTEAHIFLRRSQVPGESVIHILLSKSGRLPKSTIFANEALELLQTSPEGKLPLFIFAHSYANHFGKEIRLQDYAHSHILGLLESIPWAVEIREGYVTPVLEEYREFIIHKVCSLLSVQGGLTPEELGKVYATQFGYPLHCEQLGFGELTEFLEYLLEREILSIYDPSETDYRPLNKFVVSESMAVSARALRVKELLAESRDGKVHVDVLIREYAERHGALLNIESLFIELTEWLEIGFDHSEGPFIVLRPLKRVLVCVHILLNENSGYIRLDNLKALHRRRFGFELNPRAYGFPGLSELLSSFTPEPMGALWRRPKKMILLKEELFSVSSSWTLENGPLRHTGNTPPITPPVMDDEDELFGFSAAEQGPLSPKTPIEAMHLNYLTAQPSPVDPTLGLCSKHLAECLSPLAGQRKRGFERIGNPITTRMNSTSFDSPGAKSTDEENESTPRITCHVRNQISSPTSDGIPVFPTPIVSARHISANKRFALRPTLLGTVFESRRGQTISSRSYCIKKQ